MPSYPRTLQSHLAAYKAFRLGVKEPGLYVYRGRTVKRAHILPKELQWLNILEPYRGEVRKAIKPDQLHKYFHHLNSSQAFAFNLFFPFFQGDPASSAALLDALQVPGDVADYRFEYVPDRAEETNVDAAWKSSGSTWTFCEVKLSEQDFGQAKGEARHHKKLERMYRPGLKDHCPAEMLEPPAFFENYQIMRNLWVGAKSPGSRLLFLLPRRNEGLWQPLRAVLSRLKSPLKERVVVTAVEDTIAGLIADKRLAPKLRAHAEALAEKYVLP